jgi:hypothetical protein
VQDAPLIQCSGMASERGRRIPLRPTQFLNRWTSALGGEGDEDSDEDRYQWDRAPPMLPEGSQSVVALTPRPEESEQDEQSARHKSDAPHLSKPGFTRSPLLLRWVG